MKKCFNCGKLLSSMYPYHTCVNCIKNKKQKTEYESKVLDNYARNNP